MATVELKKPSIKYPNLYEEAQIRVYERRCGVMARYIDAAMLMSEFEDLMKDDNVMCPVIKVLDVFPIIDNIPTADVLEVVRCKDCKRAKPLIFRELYKCRRHNACRKANDYCSYGERRDI